MRIPPNVKEIEKRGQISSKTWVLRFAALLALLVVATGLFLPVLKSKSVSDHPMPPGQLLADWRTLLAAGHYLCEVGSDFKKNPVRFTESSPSIAMCTNCSPIETSIGFSNQTTLFNASSNSSA